MSSESVDTVTGAEQSQGREAPSEGRGDTPIAGGRRLGDDPFLPDEGLFWWLPRSFSLLVVAVALMMLGAHFFGGDELAPATPQEVAATSAPVVPAVPAPSEAVVTSPTRSGTPAPAHAFPTVQPRSALPPVQRQRGSLDASRSYNARRRAFLQEGEDLLRALPPEGTGDLDSERDRRAIREFIQRMDTPAR